MNRQCIVFITDRNYLFPTFVAASQARQWATPGTDVLLILSEAMKRRGVVEKRCEDEGIILMDASETLSKAFAEIDQTGFQRRISVTALGRLLLNRILPEQYEQVIYIDGDTQITGPLKELEELEAPEGRFFACADYLVISAAIEGRDQPFVFNSGVLKFARKGWIGEQAFDYFAKNSHLKMHDQDALNAVGQEACIRLSNRWNFPKQFLHLVDPSEVSIVHYMAHPKPWHGVFFPWKSSATAVYDEAEKKFPDLAEFRNDISFVRKAVYRARSTRSWMGEMARRSRARREVVGRFVETVATEG